MRADRVANFHCPRHGSALRLSDATEIGGEIQSGKLIAPEGCAYPIEQGVSLLEFLLKGESH